VRILVTGATGLIGSRLLPILVKAGHAVVATSRDPESIPRMSGVLPFGWDGKEMLQVPGAIDGIVHLAGEPIVGKRWSEARKQRIHDSRIISAQRINEYIQRRRPQDRPKVFVSANGVGYYGMRPEGIQLEDMGSGDDFLAGICKQWEDAVRQSQARTVVLRIGHVLSLNGGYLGKLLPFARIGLAGPLGGGKQPMPWVHIDDVCATMLWALTHPHAKGVYNMTAPQSITQKQFVKALNKFVWIPSIIPIPGFALKIRFGEVAHAILGGQDAPPSRLLADGYEFGHTDIHAALSDLLRPKTKRRAPKIETLQKAAIQEE
jgi:uncharacterized protein